MIIGTVPYLNSLPLTKYLPGPLTKLPPAALSQALLAGKVEVALLPLFSIIKHGLRMHPDAGIIACDGAIESVGFYTRPYIDDLRQIRSVYLDKDSLSSAYLAKIVLKKFYGHSLYDLEFVHHDKRMMADAQLLIGDKALFFDHKRPYRFWDLGGIWKNHTGLGFMFACWASQRPLTPAEVDELRRARDKGLATRDRLALEFGQAHREKIFKYLTKSVVYQPTPAIKNGLRLYREYLAEYNYDKPLDQKVA